MGQTKSKEYYENKLLSKKTYFSKKEIRDLRHTIKTSTKSNKSDNITPDIFKQSVKKCFPLVSPNDDYFLEQLYSAFNPDNNKAIEFSEFVDGLSVFVKGNPEEKLSLSFKLYDVNHDGYLTREELERVMLKLSETSLDEDKTTDIKQMIERMFRDFDIDNDGRLSFEEYKLSAVTEPLIVDFLEQFLVDHRISNYPRAPSRAPSVASHLSGVPNKSPVSSSRLSIRLSQAELLEYSHQQQKLSAPSSPTGHSRQSLSRPTSMTSIDVCLTSLESQSEHIHKIPTTTV
ncbi:EF-hand [Backusella circina FSU 941]|nr:EF-hand [Backusella circina FSU 941]